MKARAKVANWVSKSRWRLHLLFLPLMILPIAFCAYSVGRLLKQQTERQAITESSQIGRLSATLIEEHFRQSTAYLEAFAVRPLFRQAWMARDLNEVGYDLAQAHALRPDFVFLSVYDLDGNMRAIYPPEPALLNRNFAYRDWYKGVTRQWSPYISEVYQTAVIPKQLVVATAVPLRDAQGKPIGILMAPYALNTISQWLAETKLEGGWTISLVDQSGHLSAHANIEPYSPPVDQSDYEPIKRVRSGQAGNGIFVLDHKPVFTRYQPVRRYGWGVLVEQPSAALQEGAWAVGRRVWVLGVLFLAVGVGLSVLMGSVYTELEIGNRFINLSIDMFCIAGGDGFFKNLNPAWQNLLGFTTNELMAKPYLDFVHPEDRQATVAEGKRLRNGEVTLAFENRYRCKDDSYKWLLWNAVSVPTQKVIYAVARDITERKKSEKHLVQMEGRYRGLLEAAPDAMVVVNQIGEIVLLNVQAEKQFGYRRDELVGQKVKNIIPEGFAERLIADGTRTAAEALAQQIGTGVELYGRRKDGSEFPIEIMLSPLENAEGILVTAAIRDICVRKRSEEHLLKTVGELKRSNDELQQFADVASHDLQEPLRMVASFTQLLATRYTGRLDSDADEFITYAVDGCKRMQGLVQDLLAYSRAGTNGKALREISGENALREALTNLRATIEESGAVVTHDWLPAIRTDDTQLAQVFQNLVGNAIKYRSAEVPHVHVSAKKNGGNEWIFSVRDNGLGIDPQYFERIFILFQRLHGRSVEGTGIGLAICKKIVERLDGRIWVESQPGKGSTFHFALPERDGK